MANSKKNTEIEKEIEVKVEPSENFDPKEEKSLEEELVDMVESTESLMQEMSSCEESVKHEDILSAVHSDIQEVLKEKELENMERAEFDNELDNLDDESDLPVWDDSWEEEEDWEEPVDDEDSELDLDELLDRDCCLGVNKEEYDDEEYDDEEDENSTHSSPFSEKLGHRLGRTGRVRKHSFDSDDLDFSDKDWDDIFGTEENSCGWGSESCFGKLGHESSPFGWNTGSGFGDFSGDLHHYGSNYQKSGLDNMKSHLEDRIEKVGTKIVDNKEIIAAGIIGTVGAVSGILLYKFFKHKK